MNPISALVTNSTEFLGPPAVSAMRSAGIQVLAHDASFSDESARSEWQSKHSDCIALSEQSPKKIIQEAISISKRLNVIVSNDSYPAIHKPIEHGDVADLQITLDRLVAFPYELFAYAIPHLKAQEDARVVMITSSRTKLAMAGGAIPDIARAGENAFVKSLSIELAPFGIPVNAVAPNFVYSETYFPKAKFVEAGTAGADYIRQVVPRARLGQPQEAEELILFLATMKGSFLTGSIIDFDGGWPVAVERPK